jgi:hypothetical protein
MTTLERSFEEAPPLPFLPHFHSLSHDPYSLRAMLAFPPARTNRRRRRPPLALALVCLLSSTGALVATSSEGEARMTAMVPPIRKTMEDARTAMIGSEHERGQISFNEVDFR